MANVLVVDDSKFSRKRVVEAVVSAGHSVVEAADGQEGLDLIDGNSFDCVVTDNLMPVMEGMEMLRTLRENGNTLPVIVCSADVQQSTRTACEELGIVGFLGKPFKQEELVGLLAQACGALQDTPGEQDGALGKDCVSCN